MLKAGTEVFFKRYLPKLPAVYVKTNGKYGIKWTPVRDSDFFARAFILVKTKAYDTDLRFWEVCEKEVWNKVHKNTKSLDLWNYSKTLSNEATYLVDSKLLKSVIYKEKGLSGYL